MTNIRSEAEVGLFDRRARDIEYFREQLEEQVLYPSERRGQVLDFHVHDFDPTQTPSEILAAMDGAHVEYICLLTPFGTPAGNERLIQLAEESQGRILGFGLIPDLGLLDLPNQAKRLHERRALWGLKIIPNLLECYPSDERLYPFYDLACELDIPILFHGGIFAALEKERRPLSKYSQPLEFEEVIRAFPRLKMVVAHMAWPWTEEMVAVAYMSPNVSLDISTGAPRAYKLAALKAALDVLGENKLIYGSDAIGPVDATSLSHHLIDTRLLLSQLNVPRRVEAKIMYENARGLLGLPRTTTVTL